MAPYAGSGSSRHEVVSLYVDQKPEGDQSAERARSSVTVYPPSRDTGCGGDKLAVDACSSSASMELSQE